MSTSCTCWPTHRLAAAMPCSIRVPSPVSGWALRLAGSRIGQRLLRRLSRARPRCLSGKTIASGYSITEGGSCALSGYAIVAAEDLGAAVELAKGCPVLEVGGKVDVYETITM